MANPYEVLTTLITVLKTKLDAGTATPQEVLIYTKGAELLRAGGDIDAIVAGLLYQAKTALEGAVDGIGPAATSLTTAAATLDTTAGTISTAVSTATTTITSAIANAHPVGRVIQSVGVPPGGKWLKLDGSILSQAAYPDLYTVIGQILLDRIDVGQWAGTTGTINSICVSGGVFIAVGTNGITYTSTDAVSWTARTSQFSTSDIYRVAGDGSMSVMVGQSGKIATSSDNGATWTSRTSGVGSYTLNDVIYGASGGGGWVAVGQANATNPVCCSSLDGVTWTNQTPAGVIQAANKVIWTGTSLVMVGGVGMIQTSPTAAAWTNRTSGVSANLTWAASSGANVVAVGASGTIVTSADHGATWTQRTSGVTNQLNHVVYANGLWVAVGNAGTVLTSTDMATWILRETPVSDNLTRSLWTGSRWVVVGASSALIASSDGSMWSKPLENPATVSQQMNAAAYYNGRFVAVGNSGYIMRQWSAYNPSTEFALPEVVPDHYGVHHYVRALA